LDYSPLPFSQNIFCFFFGGKFLQVGGFFLEFFLNNEISKNNFKGGVIPLKNK